MDPICRMVMGKRSEKQIQEQDNQQIKSVISENCNFVDNRDCVTNESVIKVFGLKNGRKRSK